MADLRTKIYGFAGALLCAGMAYAGPATCAAPTAVTSIIRAEGTTEQVSTLTFVCTATAGGAFGALGYNLQLFLSPALPVTSRVITATGGFTEATLSIGLNAAAPTANALGTVSGSTVNFSGTTPATVIAGDTLTFVVTNIRVNASSLSVGSGVPPSISETPFISGAAVIPAALASTTVAFAQNGLGTVNTFRNTTAGAGAVGTATGFPNNVLQGTSAGANNFVICNPYSPSRDSITLGFAGGAGAAYSTGGGKSLAAVIEVNENFASAFRTAADPGEVPQTVYAVGAVVGGAVVTVANTVTSVHFKISYANVPSNVTLVSPVGPIPSQVGIATATWVTSDTGATAAAADGITGELGGVAGATALPLRAIPITAGAGSVTYNISTSDTSNLDRFEIPVFVIVTANSVAGSSTAMTASVGFAPIGGTTVPAFVVGSSTVTKTLSTFNLCTTSMLFPFVTNQLGFDTGLAISNTSTDPFGALGATPQAGTCTLNFYGNGAPTPSNVTTPNVPTGTTYSAPLSSVAAGFQGYVIAQCSFQYAHGFAFVTNGVGVNGGLSQGYLAGIIPDVNQKARGADPLSVAGAGTGENLGN